MTFFVCHVTSRDHVIKGSYEFIGGLLYWVTTSQSVVIISLVEVKTQRFNLSPDATWPDDRRFMWKKKYNIFHLLHDHPVRFGSYVSLGSRNISFFICHLFTCIHVIKGSYDILCSSTLSKPIILSYLLAASLLEVEIHCFLFVLWLHVTASSKDHAELYVAPVKFGGRGNRGYGNILLFIYHMTSRDHIIKELRNFFYSKTLFIFYRLFRSRDIYPSLFFIDHIWSHDQRIMWHFV